MKGVSKQLQIIFQEILNDKSLSESERVKKICKNRSYLSFDDLENVFNRRKRIIMNTKKEVIRFLEESPLEQRTKSTFRTGLAQIKITEKGYYITFYDNEKDEEIGFFSNNAEIY